MHAQQLLSSSSKSQDLIVTDATKHMRKPPFVSPDHQQQLQRFYEATKPNVAVSSSSEDKNATTANVNATTISTEAFARADLSKDNASLQHYLGNSSVIGDKNRGLEHALPIPLEQQEQGLTANQTQPINLIHGGYLEEDLVSLFLLFKKIHREYIIIIIIFFFF
ncbi:hypothetical protein RFI_05438 [Reticulomyxa filosa]|uniref:Uncharacterized protein n=1 Tax=Reticulomyxa filosa TaxID=46433 RepID=X6P0S4_RETFI|nr:hypothetical protein RFI_05438 [Reticulomyxa filosa]|eukprot:ETO31679.1 hypothetical protein RFI_05438 [Reticulomyxa filosa]